MVEPADHSVKSAGRWPASNAYRRAIGHSARVRRLKILLPIAALVVSLILIAVSVVRAYLPENLKIESARIENGKVVMEKPAISGRNADGINYSMIAERALQDIKNPNLITLETIKAAVPVDDKTIARIEAISGIFDRSSDRIDLTEPFEVKLTNGIAASFKSGYLDVKNGRLESKEPVSITANKASIVAQSLKMTDKGRIITFAGSVLVHIDPSTIRNQGK